MEKQIMHFRYKYGLNLIEPTCDKSRKLYELMRKNITLDDIPILAELGFMVQFDGDKTSSLYLSKELENRELIYTISQDKEHILYDE